MSKIESDGRRIHDFITGGCEDGCPSFEAEIDRAERVRINAIVKALHRGDFATAWAIAGALRSAYNPEAR